MGPEHRGMYIWLSTASYSLKVSFSSYLKRKTNELLIRSFHKKRIPIFQQFLDQVLQVLFVYLLLLFFHQKQSGWGKLGIRFS